MSHTGKCFGGPMDGKFQAANGNTFKVVDAPTFTLRSMSEVPLASDVAPTHTYALDEWHFLDAKNVAVCSTWRDTERFSDKGELFKHLITMYTPNLGTEIAKAYEDAAKTRAGFGEQNAIRASAGTIRRP